MTDLVVRSSMVGASEWLQMNRQAEMLAQSSIIPPAYRRQAPNIIVAALTGRTFGWDVLTAIRLGHVIEGTYTLKPEAMLALARRAGHSVTITHREGAVDVVGKRCDTGDEMAVTYTMEDARRAKLAERATWKQHPQQMLQWRAVGNLCRALFGDVTLGLYTPDELGADLNEDGEIDIGEIDHRPSSPAPLSESALTRLGEACATEGFTTADVLGRAFPDGLPDRLTDEHLPHLRDVFREIVTERAEIVEGEVVEAKPEVRPASHGKVGLIKGNYERMGYDRDDQLATTSAVIGRPIESHNDLDDDEASKVLDYQNGLEP